MSTAWIVMETCLGTLMGVALAMLLWRDQRLARGIRSASRSLNLLRRGLGSKDESDPKNYVDAREGEGPPLWLPPTQAAAYAELRRHGVSGCGDPVLTCTFAPADAWCPVVEAQRMVLRWHGVLPRD